MLYATTRSKVPSYTARRAVKEEWAPDGGLYIPAQIPWLAPEDADALLQRSAPEIVAQIFNLYFRTKLTGPEVVFVVGRRFYKTVFLGRKTVVGELWRNADGEFDALCRRLSSLICAEMGIVPSVMWMRIICRVALLFAIAADVRRESPEEELDVAVLTKHFEAPYAAWMARKMGLNIGTIICCDNGNGVVWDLFNRGNLRLNGDCRETLTPECNVTVPRAMELYFHSVLGLDGSAFEKLESGGVHSFSEEEQLKISAGFAATVISDERVLRTMPNLYNSYKHIFCPYGALLYAGVEDCRSQSGRARRTILLQEHTPMDSADQVTKSLRISHDELRQWCAMR